MALAENDYIKYDMTLEEYYINTSCVANYTTYSSDELLAIKLDDKAIKAISHIVYRLIYTYYRGHESYKHKQFMRMKIYDNTQGEVTALMFAMIEAVKGAVESGMDLNAYIDNPKSNLPYTVNEELEGGMLLNGSQKIGNDFNITYTSEELANHAT